MMLFKAVNITKKQKIYAQTIVKIYERIVTVSSIRLKNSAVIEVAELLCYFSKEMLIQSIKNYSMYCNKHDIGEQFRYDSNTFFKSVDGKGVFALYLYDSIVSIDSLMAYECCNAFIPRGNCRSYKDKTSYCRCCEFNKSRQNTVELANNSRSYEYAGTGREMAVHK